MNASRRINDFDYEPGGCGTQILFIIAIGIVLFLTGCKSIQYVPVPEYHHDSIYFTNVKFDSIFVKDSTSEKEYKRGDTLYIEKTRWHTKYKEVAVHDTSYIEKIDSVPVPYPVERQATLREKMYMKIGKFGLIPIIISIVIIVFYIKNKFRL